MQITTTLHRGFANPYATPQADVKALYKCLRASRALAQLLHKIRHTFVGGRRFDVVRTDQLPFVFERQLAHLFSFLVGIPQILLEYHA